MTTAVTTTSVDAITARVIGGRLTSIAEEMSTKLIRMGFSILIKESEDIGCALLDARGWHLAQSPNVTPLQMRHLPFCVQGMLREIAAAGDTIAPGDVLINNSPYLGASHSPDVAFIVPVFHKGDLVAFAAAAAHHIDIGCSKPGTSVLDAVDAWAEGLQFKGVKIRDRGEDCHPLWKMIADNVRIPSLVIGDMRAQIAACEMGAQRLCDLMDEVGRDQVFAAQQWLEDYSERMLRHEIAELPDGDYRAEGLVDGFQADASPRNKNLKLVVTLKVRGDHLEVDLTGTAPQLDNLPLNMPFEGTVTAAVHTVVRSVLLDSDTHDFVPHNRGIMRALTITAPEGTLVNPRFPAPTLARAMPGCILSDTVVKAFAQIVPEWCCAGSGPLSVFTYTGLGPNGYWVHMDISEGSYGARYAKDGMDAMDMLFSNTRCAPVEEIETVYPLRFLRWELNDYPVGHGRFRGGKGGLRDLQFLTDGYISSEADGHVKAPWGFMGGTDGHPGEMWANPEGESPERLTSKLPGRQAVAGDVYRVVAPNGGGMGPPRDRDPALVLHDVLDGIVSVEEARTVYGVVVDPANRTVDEPATRRLRTGGG
ncbi:MAG: hydantoinase B/oxoprolinase family protein [Actinobacteria bacterium]|nr:MAG: hydantoinase B/oxoprolinase family protein [Actinomycetota bacterium]